MSATYVLKRLALIGYTLLVVSLIGLTLFPLAAEPIWSQVFAPAPPDHHRLKQHTLALIQSALSAPNAGPSA